MKESKRTTVNRTDFFHLCYVTTTRTLCSWYISVFLTHRRTKTCVFVTLSNTRGLLEVSVRGQQSFWLFIPNLVWRGVKVKCPRELLFPLCWGLCLFVIIVLQYSQKCLQLNMFVVERKKRLTFISLDFLELLLLEVKRTLKAFGGCVHFVGTTFSCWY